MIPKKKHTIPRLLASIRRQIERTVKLYLAWFIVKSSRSARLAAEERCWLLGAMSGKAYIDNSAALHRYLVENRPDVKVYWVIDRDSPDAGRAKEIGPVLYREDLNTYVYGLLARVHVISHGLADVPTCGSGLSRHAIKVRLGHGLTALKQTKGSFMRSVKAKSRLLDLVPVSSEFERENKLSWGIDPANLIVAGLPRFDELVRKSRQHAAQAEGDARPTRILYMPTWRDWLPLDNGEFRKTDFYAHLNALLLHPELNTLLVQYGVVLDVCFHVMIQGHAPLLARDLAHLSNIRILPPERDLQDSVARSRVLITDYSSIAWDFLYLDRPVLFYQFDVDEFYRHRGSYIDLRDLFGPVVHEADTVVAWIREMLANNFDPGPYRSRMEHWQRKAFEYRDTRNCERVVQAILQRLETQ